MTITRLELEKHLNQLIRLERTKAVEVGRVVRRAQSELQRKIERNPNTLMGQGLQDSMDTVFATLPADATAVYDPESLLQTGLTQGSGLVRSAANVPLSVAYTPTLDLNSLAIAESEFIDRIRNTVDELKENILLEVRTSLALGESIYEIQQRIVNTNSSVGRLSVLDSNGRRYDPAYRAEMIARTTTNDLISRGKQSSYEQWDEEFPNLKLRKRISNVGDNRTSEICEHAVGIEPIPIDAYFTLINGEQRLAPPFHVNCRSTIIPIAEPYSKKKNQRPTQPAEPTESTPATATAPALPAIPAPPKPTPPVVDPKRIFSNDPRYTPAELDKAFKTLPTSSQQHISNFTQKHDIKFAFIDKDYFDSAVMDAMPTGDRRAIRHHELQFRADPATSRKVGGYVLSRKDNSTIKTTVIRYDERHGRPSLLRQQPNYDQRLKQLSESIAATGKRPFIIYEQDKFHDTLHELGHQVHFAANAPHPPAGVSNLSVYSDSAHTEWFAEHYALYLTNPDLYDEIEPVTSAFIKGVIDSVS